MLNVVREELMDDKEQANKKLHAIILNKCSLCTDFRPAVLALAVSFKWPTPHAIDSNRDFVEACCILYFVVLLM